jgi:thiol:disulfide interchange protein
MVATLALALCCAAGREALGQFFPPGDASPGTGAPPLGGPLNFGVGVQEKTYTVTAQFAAAANGQSARLFITAEIAPEWHISSITQQGDGPLKTKIELKPSPQYRRTGDFLAHPAPEKKFEPLFNNTIESHYTTVTWHAPIELAAGVDPATVRIEGTVAAQACTPDKCMPPEKTPFTAQLGPGLPVPLESAAASAAEQTNFGDLLLKLWFAFLGGLILNFMPCVLPVISLKLLSFLEQAGESRVRVFMLNVWYVLGVMAVFMALAVLAASAGYAWGELFTLPWFKVSMTALVFVMALSFLGVWEIPIPGFVGAGKAGELQTKEGASGAFFKGIFATVLATPCSGPFLGPVFAYLLTQPPHVVYMIFAAIGLGMASPYLVIGAFPELIRFLPKPGAWMETFKQVMAFLLLGTVVYLFSTLTAPYFIPTFTLLVGLWFACWLIGRTPLTASPQARQYAWAGGLAVAALAGALGFVVLLHEPKIAWQPFSPEAVRAARAQGQTVMVEFTADWCPTCKYNLRFAIDTDAVKKLLDENRVTPMIADWTDRSDRIKQALHELGYNSIPLLAIWPPEGKPIILVDLLREGQVLDALKKAGPSKAASAAPIARRDGAGAG